MLPPQLQAPPGNLDVDQHRIWDHFQTTRVDSFDHARGRYAAMAAAARRHLGRDGGSVLNIGIGPGTLERLLLQRGWQVSSLDPSPAAIDVLRPLGVDARCGLAQEMDFASGAFDVVIASEVLEHIAPDVRPAVLARISGVLAPGGWFIGSVPYREVLADQEVICPDCGKVFHRWGHVSRFDIPDLSAELASVFDAPTCRLTGFVDWRAARGAMPLLKASARAVLARLGEPIASPSIAFAARRRGRG